MGPFRVLPSPSSTNNQQKCKINWYFLGYLALLGGTGMAQAVYGWCGRSLLCPNRMKWEYASASVGAAKVPYAPVKANKI